MNKLEQKTCTGCGASISSASVVCEFCYSRQKGWKNTLLYITTAFAILVLAASLITHTLSVLPNARKAIFWHEQLNLIAFKTARFPPMDKIFVASNNGDGSLFISHVVLEGFATNEPSSHFTSSFRIGKSVEPHNFINYAKSKKEAKSWHGSYVHDVSDQEWLSIRSLASKKSNSRFRTVFFSIDDLKFLQLKEKSRKKKRMLRTFPVKGTIYYYSTEDTTLKSINFDAVACITKRKGSHSSEMFDSDE
ncbi:MAG TPA: hypothetical protein ENJ32_01815 [Crenotrichaceae bacterium]|nr:hypothetical protein [Crenotrichaceae bacterium]